MVYLEPRYINTHIYNIKFYFFDTYNLIEKEMMLFSE